MSNLNEYKCPACTGVMNFDSTLQKMKCVYCGTTMGIEEFQEQRGMQADVAESNDTATSATSTWVSEAEAWNSNETSDMKVLTCNSCGGEIVASKTDITSVCPFCSNNVLITSQFAGDLKPNYCIPFKLTKDDAINAYKNNLKGKPFLPKIFKTQSHIEEIKGVYVPFWIFDTTVNANVTFSASTSNTTRSGDTEYTTIKDYSVERIGSINFSHIPTDASKQMDDALMDSIEPYNFNEAVDFQPAYMAGYVANRYDVSVEECMNRAKDRVEFCTLESFTNSVRRQGHYDSVSVLNKHMNIGELKYSYALYPVWLLNTKWNGKIYSFAMNAQTGKLVGDLPVGNKEFWLYVLFSTLKIAAVILVIIYALSFVL